MNDRSPWLRLAATAALLAAVAVSARGGLRRSESAETAATACDINPPRDGAGLERCLARHPRDIELMLDLGSIYEADRRGDRAEALYRLALTIDPKDADLHIRLGRLLLGRGDGAGAARAAHVALALQPGSSRARDLMARAGGGAAR